MAEGPASRVDSLPAAVAVPPSGSSIGGSVSASRWRVGGEGGGGGYSGCLHLVGMSEAVSMAMGVKIAGMSQRCSACREVLTAGRELKDEERHTGSGRSRAPVFPEPEGEISAGRRTDAATALFTLFTLNGMWHSLETGKAGKAVARWLQMRSSRCNRSSYR
ncbi:unnamed protein product [Pleuronectes platessa]|uniref:Uncharacterized protein n=1 Tax=Pleuronectes platessa TaxID=8262 RepID=A0A9N7Y267_PLEPL|nr:unnamed protein product [Pleuronectes platessa]